MARDIFGRVAEYGGSFSADLVTLNFGKLVNAKGSVVQRMQMAYQQAISRLFEIGSSLFYYVGGRASGEASLDKIMGPGNIIDEFIATYGDICSPEAMQITLKSSGCTALNGQVNYPCSDCVATGIGQSVAANDMLVNQNCRVMIGWIAR
jgi:hypothetical protein